MITREDATNIYGNNLVFFDGYDDCISGICLKFGHDPVVCYDYRKIIRKLINDNMTYEEAVEFFEFNILGTYAGENTPSFVDGLE